MKLQYKSKTPYEAEVNARIPILLSIAPYVVNAGCALWSLGLTAHFQHREGTIALWTVANTGTYESLAIVLPLVINALSELAIIIIGCLIIGRRFGALIFVMTNCGISTFIFLRILASTYNTVYMT